MCQVILRVMPSKQGSADSFLLLLPSSVLQGGNIGQWQSLPFVSAEQGPHTETVHPHSSLTATVTPILGYRKLRSRHIEVLKARPTSIGRLNTQIHHLQSRSSFISHSQFSNIRVHHQGLPGCPLKTPSSETVAVSNGHP